MLGAGGGGGSPFGPAPFLLGGGGRGSKKSAPEFAGPQGEPAHGLHPRFVVAEIWADGVKYGGGGGQSRFNVLLCWTYRLHAVSLPHSGVMRRRLTRHRRRCDRSLTSVEQD